VELNRIVVLCLLGLLPGGWGAGCVTRCWVSEASDAASRTKASLFVGLWCGAGWLLVV
jgi:hypothetical protein